MRIERRSPLYIGIYSQAAICTNLAKNMCMHICLKVKTPCVNTLELKDEEMEAGETRELEC